MEKGRLPNPLLAFLAVMHHEGVTPGATRLVFGSIPPEITELASRGLVEIRDSLVVGNRGARLTVKGKEQLQVHGVSQIAQALQEVQWFLHLAYYVEMLPRDALPPFLVHNMAFIRGAAKLRLEELSA